MAASEILTFIMAEGSFFRSGTEGRGMLYFFLCHLDFCYMHVLTDSSLILNVGA